MKSYRQRDLTGFGNLSGLIQHGGIDFSRLSFPNSVWECLRGLSFFSKNSNLEHNAPRCILVFHWSSYLVYRE